MPKLVMPTEFGFLWLKYEFERQGFRPPTVEEIAQFRHFYSYFFCLFSFFLCFLCHSSLFFYSYFYFLFSCSFSCFFSCWATTNG